MILCLRYDRKKTNLWNAFCYSFIKCFYPVCFSKQYQSRYKTVDVVVVWISGQFMLLRNQEYCVHLVLLGLSIVERCCGMGIWLVWDRDGMLTDFWWGNFLENARLEDRVNFYQEEDETGTGWCPLWTSGTLSFEPLNIMFVLFYFVVLSALDCLKVDRCTQTVRCAVWRRVFFEALVVLFTVV